MFHDPEGRWNIQYNGEESRDKAPEGWEIRMGTPLIRCQAQYSRMNVIFNHVFLPSTVVISNWFFLYIYIKMETPCSWMFLQPWQAKTRSKTNYTGMCMNVFLFFLPWRTRSCYHRTWAVWTPQWQNRNEGQHRLFCCPLFSHHHQAGKKQAVGRWEMANVNTKGVLTHSSLQVYWH